MPIQACIAPLVASVFSATAFSCRSKEYFSLTSLLLSNLIKALFSLFKETPTLDPS
uniref:Uncharacterized protein n=1 Tax=Anguilla anguilla TaxID=7936 RepID=A0A0E9X2Y0_ANGAN